MFNILLKIGLSFCNYIGKDFFFIKSLFVLIVNIQRCSYRYSEWYYSWSTNQILLIMLDFGFFTFNIFSLIFPLAFNDLNILLNILILSIIVGILFYVRIESYQKLLLNKPIREMNTEWMCFNFSFSEEYFLFTLSSMYSNTKLDNKMKHVTK